MISSGRLVVTREPGFVVQGFLWCGAKDKPQYHPDDKIAHRLDDAWGDLKGEDDGRETKQIVSFLHLAAWWHGPGVFCLHRS